MSQRKFDYAILKPILLVNFILVIASCKEGQPDALDTNKDRKKDTLKLLTNNQVKFWDVARNTENANNHTGEYLNWMFTSEMHLIEFTEQDQKRYQHVYGGDIIIGYLDFELRRDTLYIKQPFKEKYLIIKINADTLIVQHVGEFGLKPPILFKKAENQTELPKL